MNYFLAAELPKGTIIAFDKNMLLNAGIHILNILILAIVLTFLLYKPVKKFMKNRSARIQGEIDAAESEREEAQELKETYEKMIKNIEKEREEVLSLAHKKAVERSDHILKEAREEAENLLDRGLAELEEERDNVMDEMRKQMIELSVLAAGKFVEVSMDRETQDRYIDEALSDWEEGLWRD